MIDIYVRKVQNKIDIMLPCYTLLKEYFIEIKKPSLCEMGINLSSKIPPKLRVHIHLYELSPQYYQPTKHTKLYKLKVYSKIFTFLKVWI